MSFVVTRAVASKYDGLSMPPLMLLMSKRTILPAFASALDLKRMFVDVLRSSARRPASPAVFLSVTFTASGFAPEIAFSPAAWSFGAGKSVSFTVK